MEIPSITLNPNIEEEIKEINEFKITSGNKTFSVKIGKLINIQKIVIIIQELNSLKNYIYKSEFSLEDLQKTSKLFRIFDSIDEAHNEINEILKNKKVNIQEEETELNFTFSLSNLSSKTEDICLKIKKESLKQEKADDLKIKNFIRRTN